MKDHQYYLGKQGKTYGPFSQRDFDELLSSGKIDEYFWLWDFKAKSWKPLEAPPPPIVEGENGQISVVPISNELALPNAGFQAICHDFHHAISGELARITQGGCDLIAPFNQGGSPFGENSQIFINLFESQTGKSIQVKAKLARVSHGKSGWRYSFRWAELPKIFQTVA